MIRSGMLERLLGAMSVQTEFALAEGFAAVTSAALAATYGMRTLGVASSGPRWRGFEATIIGTGADNATINYKAWLVSRAEADGVHDLRLLCSGLATLGAHAGPGGAASIFRAGERAADTLTLVVSPYGSVQATARGSAGPQIYSPANDTVARLVVDDAAGAYGVILEFDLGTATGANAVIELIS